MEKAEVRKTVNVALIGAGFIGGEHAKGYALSSVCCPDIAATPVKKVLCEMNEEKAKEKAKLWGFEEYCTDYHELLTRDDIDIVCDRTTLEEMLTFVRTERWQHPEAEAGAHDDCVMALAIAHHIRGQQSCLEAEAETTGVKWNESQWEDYRAATPEQRKMLIERWGKPKR